MSFALLIRGGMLGETVSELCSAAGLEGPSWSGVVACEGRFITTKNQVLR